MPDALEGYSFRESYLPSNVADTASGQVDANVVLQGPTGVVGDMKKDPAANPNITQDDVSSTQYMSRETTENTNPATIAFYNQQQGMKEAADYLDPDLDRQVLQVLAKHGKDG